MLNLFNNSRGIISRTLNLFKNSIKSGIHNAINVWNRNPYDTFERLIGIDQDISNKNYANAINEITSIINKDFAENHYFRTEARDRFLRHIQPIQEVRSSQEARSSHS